MTRRTIYTLAFTLFALSGCDKLKSKVQAVAGAAEPSSGGFFDDAHAIPTKFGATVGGQVKFLELTVYPQYAVAQIQDPHKRENVDQYELRSGDVTREGPVKFMGKPPTASQLDAVCVDAAGMDFGVVPKIIKDAGDRMKYDGAHVTHLIFKRNLPFSKNALWRVYVDGERQSGSAEYDVNGAFKKQYN
jgi:hypothetical protein